MDCLLYKTKNSSKVTINASLVNNTLNHASLGIKRLLWLSVFTTLEPPYWMFLRIPKSARIGNSFLVLLGCPFGRYDLGTAYSCTVVVMSCLVNMSSDVMSYASQSGHAIYRGSRGMGLEKNLRCSLVFEQNLQF